VNGRKLEFVFLFIVEDEAVFLDEADHRGLPPRALNKGDETVKHPVLQGQWYRALTLSPSKEI